MSPAHRFHPEFGYFCPSPGLRRTLRIVLTCLVIGFIAGASGALVFRAAHDPDAGRLMVLRTDAAPARAEAMPAGLRAPIPGELHQAAVPAAVPVPERKPPPEVKGQAACEQDAPASQTWAYLDGKCVQGRPRKARAARPKPEGAASAAAPAATQPAEQPAAASKKTQKPPRSQSASRDQDNAAARDGRRRDDPAGARVSAAPNDRAGSHGPFERGPFNFFFR
jgi:hypothetical protein